LANFDNTQTPAIPAAVDSSPAPAASESAAGATATSDRPESAALVRFRSCRWMQAGEQGATDFCAHREVKPYAGTAGFDAEAWCPECQYYKLRRSPKKRPVEDYTY
jgi:hypothetical protein